MLNGTICCQESIDALHALGVHALYHDAPNYHRKQWEDMFIIQALLERGLLEPGKRGLGFAVGQEVLPAMFATRGVEVLASDLAVDQAAGRGWTDTAQHAASLDHLRKPWCPDDVMDANVTFRAVDMNAVPDDLTGFDFLWSTCSFEHLGSIEKGLDFVVNAMKCLRPGGWAVHTTEFNLSSNTDTLESPSTVIFRQQDMERLAERLSEIGCVMINQFSVNEMEMDRRIDFLPHTQDPHIRLQVNRYVSTSYGFTVHKL